MEIKTEVHQIVTSDGLKIEALAMRAQSKKGLMVLCHGRGENKESFIHRYESLCSKIGRAHV